MLAFNPHNFGDPSITARINQWKAQHHFNTASMSTTGSSGLPGMPGYQSPIRIRSTGITPLLPRAVQSGSGIKRKSKKKKSHKKR